MKIKLTSIYVDDQERALRFYTEVLGFAKKADFSQGPFRWLTVASQQEPDGTELQLARNDNPPAKAYQQAIFQQRQPAAMFFTDDVKADYERIKSRGAEFTMPPTEVTGSTIAVLNDTCGNLIQITQLTRHTDFPVLYAAAGNGRIIYEQAGSLHILETPTGRSRKLTIGVASDEPRR